MSTENGSTHPTQEKPDTLNLFASVTRRGGDSPALSDELIQLLDDFAEFQCLNAFFTSSVTAVMSSRTPVKEELIQGAKQHAEFIQARMSVMKSSLQQLCERYFAEKQGKGRST